MSYQRTVHVRRQTQTGRPEPRQKPKQSFKPMNPAQQTRQDKTGVLSSTFKVTVQPGGKRGVLKSRRTGGGMIGHR